MDRRMFKDQAALFGRFFSLMLNRSLMYHPNHPVIKQSVVDVQKAAARILEATPSLVFILDRGQFYVEEEPLDPRINVNRIAALFKKNGIQSISLEAGISEGELLIFSELFAGLVNVSSVEAVKESLYQKGVFNIKVNHVVFKKVTEEDQVVSRDALKKVTPLLDAEDQESRKRFMETLLESVLSEEFAKTLNITNMMANPAAFSRKMIDADLAGAGQIPADAYAFSDPPGYSTEVSPDVSDPPNAVTGGNGTALDAQGHFGPGAHPIRHSTAASKGETRPWADSGRASQGAALADHDQDDIVGTPGPPETAPGAARGSAADGPLQSSPRPDPKGPAVGHGAYPGATALHTDAGPTRGHPVGQAAQTDALGETVAAGQAETTGAAAFPSTGHGSLLLHQLELMQSEVQKHLHGRGDVSISDLAQAIFEMKKQLLEGIQAQKAIGIAYANEQVIVHTANQLADQVMLELVKEEYQAGKITTQRLAHLIRRIIPEAAELKRLLPQIKRTLLTAGMPMTEYLKLVGELRNELQGEELARILEESSANIGLDGQDLIEEVKRNPGQAAELIYLASEIRKGGGDDAVLSDILVEYVEHLGKQMAKDAAASDTGDGEGHLKQVMHDIESTILKKLSQMNVHADLLTRMEQRINERMEGILDKMRVEWLHSQTGQTASEKPRFLTVLQTLEQNVGEDEELRAILQSVRSKVDAGEIEENNAGQIFQEASRQRELLRRKESGTKMAEGILSAEDVMFIMEKEIARSKRYGSNFSAVALAFVSAKPKMKALDDVLTQDTILSAALEKLSTTFREVDYIGRIGKNKIMVLLPSIDQADAKKALERVLRMLHAKPLDVNGVPLMLRVAGVAVAYDEAQAPNAKRFAQQIERHLQDMVARLKNIQVLF